VLGLASRGRALPASTWEPRGVSPTDQERNASTGKTAGSLPERRTVCGLVREVPAAPSRAVRAAALVSGDDSRRVLGDAAPASIMSLRTPCSSELSVAAGRARLRLGRQRCGNEAMLSTLATRMPRTYAPKPPRCTPEHIGVASADRHGRKRILRGSGPNPAVGGSDWELPKQPLRLANLCFLYRPKRLAVSVWPGIADPPATTLSVVEQVVPRRDGRGEDSDFFATRARPASSERRVEFAPESGAVGSSDSPTLASTSFVDTPAAGRGP